MNKELLQTLRKMTLRQVLDRLPSDYIVKVGCGSGFFYCYYNDQLAKTRIEKEGSGFINDNQRFLLKRKWELDTLEIRTKKAINRVKALKRMKQADKDKEIAKITANYNKDKERLPKTIELLKKKISSYKPFLDRKVVDAYQLNESIYQSDKTLYLIIEGKGIGRYTDYDEYVKANDLTLNKEDNKWGEILKYRNRIIKEKKNTKMVKKKKGALYKIAYDELGNSIGLVERRM